MSGQIFWFFLLTVTKISCAPSEPVSLLISSTEPTQFKQNTGEKEYSQPEIYKMHVRSEITNRFSITTITSKVRNLLSKAQEATFSVVLPEEAFISGFVMEVDGKNYTAYVKEKEEAKKTYEQAVASGLGAAHVAVSARDSNRFTVSVNVEPNKKAAFYLTYEELLKRRDSRYEIVINLHPGQAVKDLGVEVSISESRKVLDVKAPPLRSGNEISADKEELDPRAQITRLNDSAIVVRFTPNVETQKQFANAFGSKENEGLQGQFVVQYEVERDPNGGEVLLNDGYFVHFFAPNDLSPLRKHIVLVLDTSGSMYDRKIAQVKQAMWKILDDLKESDLFNLVEFNSNVRTWDLDNSSNSAWFPTDKDDWYQEEPKTKLKDVTFPKAYAASKDNIIKAKYTVEKLQADGGTNIHSALKVALHLVELAKTEHEKYQHQPLILFLTDGDPTVGLGDTKQITESISEFNSGIRKSPMFALSFGDGADREFLEKLSLRNQGFSKHIYEAADASLQLQDFYRQISSPLLTNVTFKYSTDMSRNLTKSTFPVWFKGSELVIAGCYDKDSDLDNPPSVTGLGIEGPVLLAPKKQAATTSVERLWAYLTVQQYLEKMDIANGEEKDTIKKEALDLALKYHFVTKVSSLVVVKPNDTTSAIDTEQADRAQPVAALGYAPLTLYSADPVLDADIDNLFVQDRILGGGAPLSSPLFEDALEESEPIYEKAPLVLLWLNDNLTNGLLSTSNGTYDLGLNVTVDEEISCNNAPPNNETGKCKLLQSCSEIHTVLLSLQDFLVHSCEIEKYLGVCCPTNNRKHDYNNTSSSKVD